MLQDCDHDSKFMLQENDGYFTCFPREKYRGLQAFHTNPGKIPDLKAEQDEKPKMVIVIPGSLIRHPAPKYKFECRVY